MKKKPIFLTPYFKEMIWGGSRLRDVFGYDIPSNETGECWAISARSEGESIVSGGMYAGQRLGALWKNHPELFGYPDSEEKEFPLLTKIIDAKEDLSVQVHPDDAYAEEWENGSLGKTECWYILDCDADATIVIGHNAKDKEELRRMVEEGKWSELIREIPIHPGDFFQIEPGTVHAIKKGTLVLETQENSDITYRFYDYDRVRDGKKRQLHVEKSLAVATAPYEPVVQEPWREGNVTRYVYCSHYGVMKVDVTDAMPQMLLQDKAFMNASVVSGSGSIDGIRIKAGDHFILPYQYGVMALEGDMSVVFSYPTRRYSSEGKNCALLHA